MLKKSFPAVIPSNCRLLILGSLPGDRSLAEHQYYAHPQNRFWRTISTLLGNELPASYAAKLSLLARKGIALWDVCQMAWRPGSMDTDILHETPNPITALLGEHPSIKTVCFNGQKAEKLYDKYFERLPTIAYHRLPSTSPANAAFNQQQLLKYWAIILADQS
ncbi:DNA-deoxyinosine glycosylase [Sphingobacterium griseoflavum]|uniref:DNA-deoxyinosine glycosylase n=1 Tax=Sphingobacterium griseoflavum TaxID=1474952 RepID=A0ABQ3HYM1_9SPHI|nr:DNA-deoxyinosine glycosylase [Sphingobacterium griseoflavum]GHE47878.1 DNA-deoxyinosine glycosylase [Sphingobacterium griseoflavum]